MAPQAHPRGAKEARYIDKLPLNRPSGRYVILSLGAMGGSPLHGFAFAADPFGREGFKGVFYFAKDTAFGLNLNM